MKKYLGLFVVLIIALLVGATIVGAEEGRDGERKGLLSPMAPKRVEVKAEVELASEDDDEDDNDENEDNDGDDEDGDDDSDKDREAIKARIEEMRKEHEAAREAAKLKMEALRTQIKGERDAVKAKIEEGRIVGREKALERFDTAVERLTALKDRVLEHITKFEAKDVDVEGAKDFVETAETKLSEAETKIAEMNALLALSVEKLSQENKTKLRTLAMETQALLKAAHQALIDAIKSLKDAVKAELEEKEEGEDENEDDENEEDNEDEDEE